MIIRKAKIQEIKEIKKFVDSFLEMDTWISLFIVSYARVNPNGLCEPLDFQDHSLWVIFLNR